MENVKSNTANRELVISRLLDAPIELVWEVWTDPDHIASWWGPDGFTTTIHTMEVHAGGAWDLILHGPDGTDYKNKSLFKTVIPFKKLVYEHVTAPLFRATVEFAEQGDKTLLRWHMLFDTAEEFIRTVKTFKADAGLRQNVEKLTRYLAERSKTTTR
jgi:uncharacterized protein YndB with AHSA1/START domain